MRGFPRVYRFRCWDLMKEDLILARALYRDSVLGRDATANKGHVSVHDIRPRLAA